MIRRDRMPSRSRHAADSRTAAAPIARLLAAACAVWLVMAPAAERAARGAPLQQGAPLVVVLAYDHGPFRAGERIPLVRVMDGVVSGPETGCSNSHLHSSPRCSPDQPSRPQLRICNNAGESFGPFPDMNPCNCGHGIVDALRADIEVLSIEAPDVVSTEQAISIGVSVRNNGPDNIDSANLSYTVLAPNGEEIDDGFSNRIFSGIRVGQTIEFAINISPLPASTPVTSVRIRVGTELVLVRTCGPDRFSDVIDVPDPNAANNAKTAMVGVLPREFGSVPKVEKAFDAPVGRAVSVAPLAEGTDFFGSFDFRLDDAPVGYKLYRGDGTGGFAPTPFQVDAPADGGARGAFGDVNLDGQPDLVYPDGDAVRVALGTAKGTAGPPKSFPAGGPEAYLIRVADFNADASPDLLVAHRGVPTGAVAALPGNGRGGFGAPIVTPLPGDPLSIETARLDGDAFADIAVLASGETAGSPGRVVALLGDGTGDFAPSVPVPVGMSPVSIAAGDFNNDGIPDLVTVDDGSNDVMVLFGAGTGGFTSGGTFPVGAGPVGLVVGDFNGNGAHDVAVASGGSSSLNILLGNGNGGFFHVPVPIDGVPTSLAAIDFNEDGFPDIAVATTAGTGGRGSEEAGAIRVLVFGAEPVARPTISGVELVGRKSLVVTGEGFGAGATILVDGVAQKTVPDASSPGTMLTAKKGAKKIAPGRTAVVQVESAAGVLSEWILVTRP